jgi:hypothetical protein
MDPWGWLSSLWPSSPSTPIVGLLHEQVQYLLMAPKFGIDFPCLGIEIRLVGTEGVVFSS